MARAKKPLDPLSESPIGDVLAELKITEWDALIIGDGSGVGWDRGCGWSSVLIDHYSNMRKEFFGAMNPGSITVAELMASYHAILWYTHGPGKARLNDVLKIRPGGRVLVHVVTDSEITANQGNGKCSRRCNEELWAGIDSVVRRGFSFTWHWVKRDRIGLNQLTDHLSRQSRIAIEEIVLPEGTTVYDFNPAG